MTTTTNRKTACMANATPAANRNEALKVGSDLTTEVTFNDVLFVCYNVSELVQLFFAKVAGTAIRIKTGFGYDGLRTCRTNTVDVAKRVFELLVSRDVDSKDTWHDKKRLVLPLKRGKSWKN